MIRVYGIKNCDTMKKAFVWLEQHGVVGFNEAEFDQLIR